MHTLLTRRRKIRLQILPNRRRCFQQLLSLLPVTDEREKDFPQHLSTPHFVSFASVLETLQCRTPISPSHSEKKHP